MVNAVMSAPAAGFLKSVVDYGAGPAILYFSHPSGARSDEH
jgi:hypothetical protein